MKTTTFRARTSSVPDDLRIVAREAGPSSGPVVILLPGWPQTSYAWRHVQPLLAEAGCRSIAMDLPGMGESDFMPAGLAYDTGAVADLLAAAVASAGVNRFTLVGHDVGTWVAYAWATRQPQGIERLCLTEAAAPGLMPDSAFSIANAARVFQFYLNAVEELPELLTRGREREFLGWLFRTKSLVQSAIGAADLDEYVRSYSAPGRMSAGFEYYRAVPTSANQNRAAPAPRMPILALGGEGSLGERLYLSLKGRSQELEGGSMPGVGHYIPEEAPHAFVGRLLSFIKG
jgi:pimeloyl-ACP methyl ester carboxylesterase